MAEPHIHADHEIDWESELASLLAELSTVQDDLLAVLAEKRTRMASSDLDAMQQLQDQEEALATRLQHCHQRRGALLSAATDSGIAADNLRELAAVATPDKQGDLSRQVKDASARMRLLQHHSLTNWVLAQRTLLHLSQMLEIVATGGRLNPTYGQQAKAHPRGALVDREA